MTNLNHKNAILALVRPDTPVGTAASVMTADFRGLPRPLGFTTAMGGGIGTGTLDGSGSSPIAG
jgi:hypothetical protein